MDASELLAGLDPDQRLAVSSPSPLLAVVAGAGSGKTSVLTRRIAHRVATDVADPRHVVALTFTRQAAAEMRRRLRRLGIREPIAAGTFHATALGLLRQHWSDRNRRAPNVTGERARLVAEVVGPRNRAIVREVSGEIDWARARMIGPGEYAVAARRTGRRTSSSAGAIASWFGAYEDLKRQKGVVDLDDLLGETLTLMREDPSFAEVSRWRFRHLFVDEAQDLNPLQATLLDSWRAGRDDLTLVGDPNQAIYGFNGADPTLLLHPEVRFPGIEVVRLATNYRCSPEIVRAGVTVLQRAGGSADLHSHRLGGVPVRMLPFDDPAAEAAGIARLVRDARPPGGRWRSVAVLARTNAQLGLFADALRAVGIPARLSSAAKASTPLQRAIQEAGEQVDAHQLASWAVDAAQFGDVSDIDEDGTAPPATARPGRSSAEEAAHARRRVAAAVDEYLALGGGDGRGFLSWVRATDPFAEADDDADAVDLLTFHSAKGREWPHVVVAGVCTGLVPHGSATTDEQRAEEGRLLYVAMTRGADSLVLTWHTSRDGRRSERSPLLEDVDTTGEVAAPPPLRPERPPAPAPDPALEALRGWRTRAARAASLPPTSLLSDATLSAIAAARPTTVDELAAVPGIGTLMARRFGPRILEALASG